MAENGAKGLLVALPIVTSPEGTDKKCGQPDFAYFDHKARSMRQYYHKYLWYEYVEACEKEGYRPYAFSSFSSSLIEWRKTRIEETAPAWYPGECMQSYWSIITYTDEQGNQQTKPLFVARLIFSDYTFLRVCDKKRLEDWMKCCSAAFRFFGGVPHVTDCPYVDTCSSRNKHGRVFATLQAFAEHNRTVLFSLGPKTNKTAKKNVKPLTKKRSSPVARQVRKAVLQAGPMSAEKVEKSVEEAATAANRKPDGEKPSRRRTFHLFEAGQLLKLPESDYDGSIWVSLVVKPDYHFLFDTVRYSVPYFYAFDTVQVRSDGKVVEAYYLGSKIAEHRIPDNGATTKSVTDERHRPSNHKGFANRLPIRFRALAKEIGPATEKVMEQVLKECKRKGKSYRPCKDLMDLAKQPCSIPLEQACKTALEQEQETGTLLDRVAGIMKERAYPSC